MNDEYAPWRPSIEEQKQLIRMLAPRGVSRPVFMALFNLTNNQLSGRTSMVGIRFSDYTPAEWDVMRDLLLGAGVPPAEVERVFSSAQLKDPQRRKVQLVPLPSPRALAAGKAEVVPTPQKPPLAELASDEETIADAAEPPEVPLHTVLATITDEEVWKAAVKEIIHAANALARKEDKAVPLPQSASEQKHSEALKKVYAATCQWPLSKSGDLKKPRLCGEKSEPESNLCIKHLKIVWKCKPLFV